jgi:predicted RNA binding protein YcfA (HicA-like mRNA interferase family)
LWQIPDSLKERTLTARELVSILKDDGWYQERQRGSHAIFRHGTKLGIVIVPIHSGDIPKGTLNDILKKAGLKQ